MKKKLFDWVIVLDLIQKNVGVENISTELKKLKLFYKRNTSIDELEGKLRTLPEGFLSAREVCSLLKISNTTLWRYVEEGMPVIKGKKKRLFVRSQVINWYNINKL